MILPTIYNRAWLRKITALVIVVSFVFSNIAFADVGKSASTNTEKKVETVIDPLKIVVPRDYGLVKARYAARDAKKLIIHIQDAHCNYEAQSNIIKILECLIKNDGLRLVSVEGADGFIDTSWFKAFPDADIRKEVADYFMKKGEITGPEFLSITSDYPIKLFGAETRSYYIENLNAFTSSYPLKEDTERYFNQIKSVINKLKDYVYSDELKEFDTKTQDYESKKLSFTDYVRHLELLSQKYKIPLRQYENLFKLISVLIFEKKIDFNVVDKERSSLIDTITKKLDKEKLTILVNKSLEFKAGKISSAEYYDYLRALATKYGVSISGDYPNLFYYIIYNSVYSRIENEHLFNDIKKFEIDAREKMFANDDQRTLEKLSRHINILLGLANIKLLNGDFDYYKANKEEFTHEAFAAFINKMAQRYGFAYEVDAPSEAVKESMPKLEDFYSIAIRRDRALVDNTVQAMREESTPVSVLITGGFHSEGITKLLEKQNISYVVVCPNITKDVETPYIKVLTNQRTPLEEILSDTAAAGDAKNVKGSMLAPFLITRVALDMAAFRNINAIGPRADENLKQWARMQVRLWMPQARQYAAEKGLTFDTEFAVARFRIDVDLNVDAYIKKQAEQGNPLSKEEIRVMRAGAEKVKKIAPEVIGDISVREKSVGGSLGDEVIDPVIDRAMHVVDNMPNRAWAVLRNGQPVAELLTDHRLKKYARIPEIVKKYLEASLTPENINAILMSPYVLGQNGLNTEKGRLLQRALSKENILKLFTEGSGFDIFVIEPEQEVPGLRVPGLLIKPQGVESSNFGHFSTKYNNTYHPRPIMGSLLVGAEKGSAKAEQFVAALSGHEILEYAVLKCVHSAPDFHGIESEVHFIAQLWEILICGRSTTNAESKIGPHSQLDDYLNMIVNRYCKEKEQRAKAPGQFSGAMPWGLSADTILAINPEPIQGPTGVAQPGQAPVTAQAPATQPAKCESPYMTQKPPRPARFEDTGLLEEFKRLIPLETSCIEIADKVYRFGMRLFGGKDISQGEEYVRFEYFKAIAFMLFQIQIDLLTREELSFGDPDKGRHGYGGKPSKYVCVLGDDGFDRAIKDAIRFTRERGGFDLESLPELWHEGKLEEDTDSNNYSPVYYYSTITDREGEVNVVPGKVVVNPLGEKIEVSLPMDIELRVKTEARKIWEDNGRPAGHEHDDRFWRMAEENILKQDREKRMHEETAILARWIWERYGRPGGKKHELDYWFTAEKTIRDRYYLPGHTNIKIRGTPGAGAIRMNGEGYTAEEHGARLKGHFIPARENSELARKRLELARREKSVNGALARPIMRGDAYAITKSSVATPPDDKPIRFIDVIKEIEKGEQKSRMLLLQQMLATLDLGFVVVKGFKEELRKAGLSHLTDIIFTYGVTRRTIYIDEEDFNYLFSLPNGMDIIMEAIRHELAHINNELANLKDPTVKLLSESEIEKVAPTRRVRKAILQRSIMNIKKDLNDFDMEIILQAAVNGDADAYQAIVGIPQKQLAAYFEKFTAEGLQNIPEDLFGFGKGYDVRGNAQPVTGGKVDLTPLNVYIIGKLLGTYYAEIGTQALVTGDIRNHTPILRYMLALGAASTGVNVEYAPDFLTTGAHNLLSTDNEGNYRFIVQVSGSHGVPQKNGLKIKAFQGKKDPEGRMILEPLYAEPLEGLYWKIKPDSSKDIKGVRQTELRTAAKAGAMKEIGGLANTVIETLDRTLPSIDKDEIVVIDPRAGAASPILLPLLTKRGFVVINKDEVSSEELIQKLHGLWNAPEKQRDKFRIAVILNAAPDANMSRGIWDPSKPEALKDAQKLVKLINFNLLPGMPKAVGGVFDGDVDRITAILEDGAAVQAFEMTLPYYQRFLLDENNQEAMIALARAGFGPIKVTCDVRANSKMLSLIDKVNKELQARTGIHDRNIVEGLVITTGYPPQLGFMNNRIAELDRFVRSKPELNCNVRFMEQFPNLKRTYFTAEASGHNFFHISEHYPNRVCDCAISGFITLLNIRETLTRREIKNPAEGELLTNLFANFKKVYSSNEVRVSIPNAIKIETAMRVGAWMKEKYGAELKPYSEPVQEDDYLLQPKDAGFVAVAGFKIQLKDGRSALVRWSNTGEELTTMFEGPDLPGLISIIREITERLREETSRGVNVAKLEEEIARLEGVGIGMPAGYSVNAELREKMPGVINTMAAQTGQWATEQFVDAGKRMLGWMSLGQWRNGPMAGMMKKMAEFAVQVQREKSEGRTTDIVFIGQGGSVECIKTFLGIFGADKNSPRIHILDTTDQEYVAQLKNTLPYQTTRFVVLSKSMTTGEVHSGYKLFFDESLKNTGLKKEEVAKRFTLITDYGRAEVSASGAVVVSEKVREPFRAEVLSRGFGDIFYIEPATGGRYSWDTAVGILPAMIMRESLSEITEILKGAEIVEEISVNPVLADNPAAQYGVFKYLMQLQGRKRPTLILPEEINAFGPWYGQLDTESLGKTDKMSSIVINNEALAANPEVYTKKRFFVRVKLGFKDTRFDKAVESLQAHGLPVLTITLPNSEPGNVSREDFGALLKMSEFATAIAGCLMGVNPVNQDDVVRYKEGQERYLRAGVPAFNTAYTVQSGPITLNYEASAGAGRISEGRINEMLTRLNSSSSPAAIYAAILYLAAKENGRDYAPMMIFKKLALHPSLGESMRSWCEGVRSALRIDTLGEEAPCILHAKQQGFQAGESSGFFTIVRFAKYGDEDIAVPGSRENYGAERTFGEFIRAQAAGTLSALSNAERLGVMVEIKDSGENSLRAFNDFITEAIEYVKKLAAEEGAVGAPAVETVRREIAEAEEPTFEHTKETINLSSSYGERARELAEKFRGEPAQHLKQKHLIFVKSAIPEGQLATTTAINYANFCEDYYNEKEEYTAHIVDSCEKAVELLAANPDWNKSNTIVGLIDTAALDGMSRKLDENKMQDKTKLLAMEKFAEDQFVPIKGFFDLMATLVNVNKPLNKENDRDLLDAINQLLSGIGVRNNIDDLMNALSESTYFEDPIRFAKNFVIRLLPPTKPKDAGEQRELYNAGKQAVESL